MKQDIYIGMTENPFKTRYNLHNFSSRLSHKISTTTLSEHLWTQKNAGVIHKTECVCRKSRDSVSCLSLYLYVYIIYERETDTIKVQHANTHAHTYTRARAHEST